ncbi:MAG TPA: BRO family protein, partial [Ktedonobacterales bacterium]|nr:BRO family protein [Ktedonobacterales bacterium]
MPNTPQQPNETAVTLFEGQRIRCAWLDDRWYFSVVDVVGLLAQSGDPRKYWFDMKRRIDDEGFRELSAKCRQLKMEASDGKMRVTDAADVQTLLRIIQSIPSPHAEPVKQWLAQVGTERLAEMEDPSLAVDRARQFYAAQGYDTDWIEKRLQGIVIRQELTDEWRDRGAQEGREFAILTDVLHRGAFGIKTEEHKVIKRLKRRDNLRDSMTPLELVLTSLAEATATELHQAHDAQGFDELDRDAYQAGGIAGATRQQIEAQSGRAVVSPVNHTTLTARAAQPQL